ncbi:MAG: hypothetical protein CMJ21_03745 [Phycisphaerae bacterium]|nr:hypothetical protein [Phycisphaerae bacterium]
MSTATATTTHPPRVDDRDWSALTPGERIKQLEVEGYLVLPDLLTPELITQLKQEIDDTVTFRPADYSPHQKGSMNEPFEGPAMIRLLAHSPTITFLKELFGPDIVLMHMGVARSEPGHPGISLHADGQPFGSKIFGFAGSCLFLVRVLYYLDDLTHDISPFRVIPRSHICMHEQANPYLRYESHPEEVMVPCKAGSAVLINHRVFHGNFPNTGDRPRTMVAIAYRPGWAGPIDKVEPWNPSYVEGVPDEAKPLLGDKNQRVWIPDGGNKPTGMKSEAPGMNPSRWDRY